jgi:hypothetical protein
MRTRRSKLGPAVVSVALFVSFTALAVAQEPAPVSVSVEGTAESGFRLARDGKPYFVRGVGLTNGSLAAAKAAGANSVRTWGAEHLGSLLDEAQAQGMTVCAGLWLGHERHGFRYADRQAVERQAAEVRRAVQRYKDHPALLVWGIGNEMEGDGANPEIWKAIGELGRMVKELDPVHPTMTVIAELGKDGLKVRQINQYCPAIDIIGVNSYGTGATVPARYKAAGGRRPYILTEFGPTGWWESPKTAWGAAVEPTSTEKAATYRDVYAKAVANQPLCLGSYAFLWGWKQEATSTWFGLVLADGSRVAAADVLTEYWTGKPPGNRCPTIEPLKPADGETSAEPGQTLSVRLSARDPDDDPLTVAWELRREGTPAGGGDAEPDPPAFPQALVEKADDHVVIRLPGTPGGYRLFATVRDGHGGAATANLPVRAAGATLKTPVVKPRLPLLLDADARPSAMFQPTGWMGNTKAIELDPHCDESPHDGKICLRVDYKDASEWGGVVWQYPANDWGEKPGALDLSGAKRLSFWARGAKGGEVVSFKFGLLGSEKAFPDSDQGQTGEVTLTDRWTEHHIDLAGKDLTRIKTGFCWVVTAHGQPVTFYLDQIRYEP